MLQMELYGHESTNSNKISLTTSRGNLLTQSEVLTYFTASTLPLNRAVSTTEFMIESMDVSNELDCSGALQRAKTNVMKTK